MSTNCGIALRTGDLYQTISCHWDGYPHYMLPMLRYNYNTLKLVSSLISQGNASYIAERLEPSEGVNHTFDMPEAGVCVFYHRDRGDSWFSCQSVCYTKKDLFSQSAFEYVYIFEDGEWNVYKDGNKLQK